MSHKHKWIYADSGSGLFRSDHIRKDSFLLVGVGLFKCLGCKKCRIVPGLDGLMSFEFEKLNSGGMTLWQELERLIKN